MKFPTSPSALELDPAGQVPRAAFSTASPPTSSVLALKITPRPSARLYRRISAANEHAGDDACIDGHESRRRIHAKFTASRYPSRRAAPTAVVGGDRDRSRNERKMRSRGDRTARIKKRIDETATLYDRSLTRAEQVWREMVARAHLGVAALALALFFEVLTRIRAEYNNCEYIRDGPEYADLFLSRCLAERRRRTASRVRTQPRERRGIRGSAGRRKLDPQCSRGWSVH